MGTPVKCWADPLSRAERRALATKLASACKRFYDAAPPSIFRIRKRAMPVDGTALLACSNEMAALHLDVTERAEVATSWASLPTTSAWTPPSTGRHTRSEPQRRHWPRLMTLLSSLPNRASQTARIAVHLPDVPATPDCLRYAEGV